MNPERYSEICAAFNRALELEPAERSSFLTQLGDSDRELLDQVEEMIANDERAHEAFDDARLDRGHERLERILSEVDSADRPRGPHEHIGPYEVLDVLGQGGMGTVYLCQQSQPIRRQVAVKVIKLGMDSERIVQRFAIEREALERMQHPGIARLLDAGVTESGQPYFAMEHVQGSSLIEYCDELRLDIPARLRVLVKVLRALHDAHQRGILHRDLKPSNILVGTVDGSPQPKIIDFGLARAVDTGLDDGFATRTSEVIGTPAYMSPEQFDEGATDIDIRSDVYSMGVLMFALITGRLPVDLKGATPAGAILRLRSQAAEGTPSPSIKARALDEESLALAERRATDPRNLSRLIKGELDWIVLRAMETERERRYDSAGAFADDIEAFLECRPLEAGPAELGYRIRKFVRRNRLVLTSAVLVALGLVGGTVAALVSASKAHAAESQMGEMLSDVEAQNDILYQVMTQADPRFGSKDAKLIDVMSFGSEYALEKYGDRPRVLTTVLGSFGSNFRELGMYAEAEDLLRKALEYQLMADDQNHARVAYKMNGLGILLSRMGKVDEAEELYRSAIDEFYAIEDPENPRQVGVWEFNLGKLLLGESRLGEAREVLEDALQTHLEHDPDGHTGLGLIQLSMGHLERREGDLDEAERLVREALKRFRLLDDPDPHLVRNAEFDLGRLLSRRSQGRDGGDLLEVALEKARESTPEGSALLLQFLYALAGHHLRGDRPDAALEFATEAMDVARDRLSPELMTYVRAEHFYGAALARTGEVERGLEILEHVRAAYERNLPSGDPDLMDLLGLIETIQNR